MRRLLSHLHILTLYEMEADLDRQHQICRDNDLDCKVVQAHLDTIYKELARRAEEDK